MENVLYSMLLINSRGLLNITVAHVEILSAIRPYGFLHALQAKVNTYFKSNSEDLNIWSKDARQIVVNVLDPYQAEWQVKGSFQRRTIREMELLAVSHRAHRECASPWPVIHIGPWSLMSKMSCNLPSFHSPLPWHRGNESAVTNPAKKTPSGIWVNTVYTQENLTQNLPRGKTRKNKILLQNM